MSEFAGSLTGDSAAANRKRIVVSLKYDRLFRALSTASGIRTHLDYYLWLQREINAFIPHTSLLAAWGNFGTGELSLDLASSLEGESTRTLEQVPGLELILAQVFKRVRNSGRSWLMAKNFLDEAAAYNIDVQSDFYRKHAEAHSMLLAYVLPSERGEDDCMYIFSIRGEHVYIDSLVLDLVMPQVDTALRRIKCLPPTRGVQPRVDSLSDREQDVLNWVSQGKSNEEIGTILGISRNTVKNHLKRIFAKMGVTARSQAVRVYLENRH